MRKKYELIKCDGGVLFRVKALIDFGDIKAGDIGGYVGGEHNLSQEGLCWIYGNAKVFNNAEVNGNAKVFGNAMVYGNAVVCGNAKVYGNAVVYDNAYVYENARVLGNAKVSGNAVVYGDSCVQDDANVSDDAEVRGNARVSGFAEIIGNAVVSDTRDYFVFNNAWGSTRHITYTKSNDNWKTGDFYGSSDEFIQHANKEGNLSAKNCEAYIKYVNDMLKR